MKGSRKNGYSTETEANFSFLVESLVDYGVMMMDTKGRIISWNLGAVKIFGYTREEALGKPISFIFTNTDKKLKIPQLEISTAKRLGRADDERRHKKKDGSLFWASGVMWAIKDEKGKIKGLSKLISDITEKRLMEDTIRHQSLHDPLTGLPNRRAFQDRFALAILEAQKKSEILAAIYVDIDDFKKVNDTLGHDTGDILLQEVATRLSLILKKGDLICRIGGDEFILLIRNIKSLKGIKQRITRMQNIFKTPFDIGNKKIEASVSMGVSFYPQDGETPPILEKRADDALYTAKKAGKNCYKIFTDKKV